MELSELDSLKKIADNMGIAYKHNIGLESLRTKISAQRSVVENVGVATSLKTNLIQKMKRDAYLLHRVVITPMDPLLRDSQGDFYTVGNSMVGSITKFIAYNSEYHVPALLLDTIKEKKYNHNYEITDPTTGHKVVKSRSLPRFSITHLDPLTDDELQALADDQIKRGIHDED